ncbi:uncharacterized protein LOC126999979 isoform X2 [Eriocheir sinensis]|uniref:uncharacterized protein LOC126999979 isoform X2 n=1 Tax=Eriocheir sinensis TaxID=95602 RepID=UPI0021C69280|nr:uncharacterized protein LOC126999979 isoform X2 [Eriocheir sinensis]
MDTVGVWAGPSRVDGVRVVGECVVWVASEGLVTTPMMNPQTTTTIGQPPPTIDEAGEDMKEGGLSSTTQYIRSPPFTKLDAVEMSPCGRHLVLAGQAAGGESVLVWRRWPLVTSGPAQVILRGHTVHHIEFNGGGDHLGILSTSTAAINTTKKQEGDKSTRLVLSVWRWPADSDEAADLTQGCSGDDSVGPQQVVATTLDQVRAEQVTRLSLRRGLPAGEVTVMLAVGEEVQMWRLQEGPLGPQLISNTVGFGLLAPDTIYTMWCLTPDAYVLGVGSGWVMVSVGGEVVSRLGGGAAGPCHNGPLTDLHIHSSHLYTVGGDGWLRVWEAEMVEEAALKTPRGMREVEGWFEAGIKTSWLQLVRELSIHNGPGTPITLISASLPGTPVWIVQTTTGVIYGVWAREWTAHVLHQGPSERVTGVALSSSTTHHHPLLAATTHHHYLLVAALPKPNTEESLGDLDGAVQVVTTLARAQVEGVPSCVSWATCQVTGEDDLVVIGLEDGSLNVFLLHLAPKTFEKRLTLIQVERPHECKIQHISTSREAEPGGGGRAGGQRAAPILVTSADDCRLFIFKLIRGAKLTKLDPVGFHQLKFVPERISVKGTVVTVDHPSGLAYEINALPSPPSPSPGSTTQPPAARAAPDSWLLQQHSLAEAQVVWEGSKVVHQQVLEEMIHTCCPEVDFPSFLLTLAAPDGQSMIGVTTEGRIVHTCRKAKSNFSVRVSSKVNRDGCCQSKKKAPQQDTSDANDCRSLPSSGEKLFDCGDGKCNKLMAEEKRSFSVVACVAEDGAWAAAWVDNGDLFVYRAKGASFPLPHGVERKFRLVSVRGVGSSVVGPSLEQRAHKDAGERRKTAMENRASVLQQKLSKLKWDFRKVTLRADEVEGGAALLEEIPLHPSISNTLHRLTTNNMNKVVSGSSRELERLEVLLGKLRTLYSWNPLVSVPAIQFLSSSKVLTAVDNSEEVFALLSRLAQICQGGREVMDGGAMGDTETPQSVVVVKVQGLLASWLMQIRSGGKGDASSSLMPSEGEGAAGEQGDGTYLSPRPAHPLARKPASSEGDTSDEAEEHHSLAALEAQVREVVERVGSAGRPGGTDHVAEDSLDPGRQLQWRRTALTRLKQHRAGEASRSCQLATYKKEHAITQDEKKEGEDTGEGDKAEDDKDADLEEEVVVPPMTATVEEVETHLWALLGKVEEESQKTREMVRQAAVAQENLLEKVNQHQKEWGHSPLTLPHLPHHIHTQVTDDLVNEFYCDLLDLEESGEVGSVEESHRRDTGRRSSSQRASSSPRRHGGSDKFSPPNTAKDYHKHKRHEGKKEGDGTAAVPPLSLAGSPRQSRAKGRTSKTTTATRNPRTSRGATITSTPSASARTPKTKTQRSGRGRRSVRDNTPRQPPAPRPHLTLDQVQQIQCSRTHLLTSLSQVSEPLQQEAQEVEAMLEECHGRVVEEQGRLAWAVLRIGQLVQAMGIMVRYRDTEKRLRLALREKIKEQQAIKEKVLGLRQRITEYEEELQCLAELEEEVDRAFTHLVTDNAQFEVQLTRYYESRAIAGVPNHRPQSASSSSRNSSDSDGGDGRGEDEGQGGGGSSDSGDSDSGLGTDEARTDGIGGGAEGGRGVCTLRPPGCDPAVFSLVTVLRELRWRVGGAAERGRREKAVEERRHAAVMRRLHRAAHASHTALASLNTLQSEREEQLGAISCVVWLRQSQTAGDITPLTRLPVPNIDLDSMMAVKWFGNQLDNSGGATAATTTPGDGTLLTKKYLDQVNEKVAQAKVAQELAAQRHREGRAERRALAQQVEQLRGELTHLKNSYQVTKECKLGSRTEVDLVEVENKLDASLDLRWPSKVASQVARHDTTMTQFQADMASRTRELRALQKEEAALAAHILALRQERDHLHYHLKQTTAQKRSVSKLVRGVGKAEEVRQLRTTVARQDETIAALRLEINSLRDKTGTVTLPGLPPLPKPTPSPSPPAHSTSTWTEEHHSTRTTVGDRDSLPHTFRQDERSDRESSEGTTPAAAAGGSSDENADVSSSSSDS